MNLSQTQTILRLLRLRRLRRLRHLRMLWKNSKEERRLRKLGLKSWSMLLWESRNSNTHQVRSTLQAAIYHHCNRTVVSISQGILTDPPEQRGYACCGLGSSTGSRLLQFFGGGRGQHHPFNQRFRDWRHKHAVGSFIRRVWRMEELKTISVMNNLQSIIFGYGPQNSVRSFILHTPMIPLERTNTSGIAREFSSWVFCWLGKIGERFRRFGSRKHALQCSYPMFGRCVGLACAQTSLWWKVSGPRFIQSQRYRSARRSHLHFRCCLCNARFTK